MFVRGLFFVWVWIVFLVEVSDVCGMGFVYYVGWFFLFVALALFFLDRRFGVEMGAKLGAFKGPAWVLPAIVGFFLVLVDVCIFVFFVG
jgi:hypothetical protein